MMAGRSDHDPSERAITFTGIRNAALARAEPGDWRFPSAVWERLRPGRYLLRALARGSWRPLGVWTWEKP